jgi:hypothetical protein
MRRLVQDYFTPYQVIRGIRRRRQAGKVLSFEAVRVGSRDGCTLINAAIKFFGGWRQAIEAAGYSYAKAREPRRTYRTKHAVIEAIRQRRRRGWKLNIRSLQRGEHPDLAMYHEAVLYFKSWPKALTAAGISLRRKRKVPDMAKYDGPQDVLAGIAQRKRKPLPLDSHSVGRGLDRDIPLFAAGRRYFGSWRNTLKAAGIVPKKPKKPAIAARKKPAKPTPRIRRKRRDQLARARKARRLRPTKGRS